MANIDRQAGECAFPNELKFVFERNENGALYVQRSKKLLKFP